MRVKELTINKESTKIEVEVTSEPKLILIGEGKAKTIDLPCYGETKVVTHDGKIRRFRVEEGEEF